MNETKEKLVSIITPMYNSEKYILETYRSIVKQTYKNWEWLVIDDCSIDESYKIIEKISKKDERIKLFKNIKNSRAAYCRNIGLENCKGDYITFIDSDDMWDSCFLKEQISLLLEKDCNIVFSSYRRMSENLEESLGEYIVPTYVRVSDLLKTNYFSCLTVMYKKESFLEIKFNESLKMHEDYLMWLDILEKGNIAYGNQRILATYRIRSGSVSRNKLKNLFYMYFIFRKIKKFKILKTIKYLFYYSYYGMKKNKLLILER